MPGPISTSTASQIAERHRMVDVQIRARGVTDPRVLSVMRNVERHRFVDEDNVDAAYGDFPLAIGHGQTISQPYIVAFMSEALALTGGERVLEIGTGCGYQTAVLAEIAGEVYSIEIVPELAARAKGLLEGLGYTNIQVRAGDGYEGWEEHAPYDGVLSGAAPDHIPAAWIDQLRIGGRLVVPVGRGDQDLLVMTRTEQGLREEGRLAVRFVPLTRAPGSPW